MLKDIQQQKKLKVLLIGDSCIDEYFYGECNRLNPEAAVPLLQIKNYEKFEGMSSNVRVNLENLGCEVNHETNKEEIVKIRYIDSRYNTQLLRVDKKQKISRINIPKFKKDYRDKVNQFDCVVISDYNKGFVLHKDIEQIVKFLIAQNSKIKIFVDTKKQDPSCFKNCIIKINESEFNNWHKQPDNCKIITTLCERGAAYNNKIYPAYDLNLNNVTQIGDRCGAGDTFLAGLVYYICKGNTIESSIKFANYCASLTLRKIGVYQIRKEDIDGICF